MLTYHSNGERKYYLSNLPGDTPIKAFTGAIKARRICEQAHQQLKRNWGWIASKDDPGPDLTAMP